MGVWSEVQGGMKVIEYFAIKTTAHRGASVIHMGANLLLQWGDDTPNERNAPAV